MKKIVQINLESTNKKCFFLYAFFLKKMLKKLKISTSSIYLPTRTKNIVLLKSPHVYKKSKEHFIFKKYQLLIKFFIKDINIIKSILLNKPNTIKIKVLVNKGKIA